MAEPGSDARLTVYETVRGSVSAFDAILVSLLTQGNVFVIAILSIPLVAKIEGIPGACITFFALLLGLFLLLANLLYWHLLVRATAIAERIEREQLAGLGEQYHLTVQLNQIPLSAARGSRLLYLVLPAVWVPAAVGMGVYCLYAQAASGPWYAVYLLACVVALLGALLTYAAFLHKNR